MVSDALHDIAHHLGIEEMQGQAHQLGEEIGDQGDIDPRVYVQQYPAPYEVTDSLALKLRHCALRQRVV